MPDLPSGHVVPAPGGLWLSRPPYLLVARVLTITEDDERRQITFELLDDDASRLIPPVTTVLDDCWWRGFQPLIRRDG